MPQTTNWSITYPDSNSSLTPLESHFQNLATTADTAISTVNTSVTNINNKVGFNLQVTSGTPTGAPSYSGPEGSLSWDSVNNILYIYDTNAWKVVYRNDGTWVSYTPTISGGSTTTWALGNGTIAASYTQIGKTVHFKGSLKIGSSTVVGDASLTMSLPLTSVPADANGVFSMTGTGRAGLSNLASTGFLAIVQTSTTTFFPQLLMTASAVSNPISRAGISTSNYTKTTGDLIIFNGTYEVA